MVAGIGNFLRSTIDPGGLLADTKRKHTAEKTEKRPQKFQNHDLQHDIYFGFGLFFK